MKKYDKYKDSGIEWIGQVPEHWELKKFKYFLELITMPSTSHTKIGLENIEGATGKYVPSDSDFEGNGVQFLLGDIVYGKLRPYLRKVWLAEFEGNAVGDFFVFRSKCNSRPAYVKYLMLSDNFTSVSNGSTYGAKMPRVSSDFIMALHWFLPALSEQEAIAAYLDEKTGQIDALMAEKSEQLKDLQTLRTSIITEAVTKGLNPNAPMKDSGMEWIGEIPAGWDYLPLKRIAFVQTGSTPSTEYEEFWNDGDFNWYTPSDFSDDSIFLESSNRKITNEAISHNAARCFPANTVMIVGIGATLGKVGISKNICSANQQINGIFFNERMLPLFGAYFLYSARQHIKSLSNSATLPIINQTATGEIKICIPPLSEQRAIAAYLDEKTSEIDAMKAELTAQIEDLKTLRTSLITEAVTGQVDVRDWKTKH